MCTPFVGPNFPDFRLHLLLLGKHHLTSQLRKLIVEREGDFAIHLEISLATDLFDLAEKNVEISFDFIFICLDMGEQFTSHKVQYLEEQLGQMDQHYRFASRVALILAWDYKGFDSISRYRNVFDCASRLGLPAIRGDINDPELCEYLTKQVLEMAISSNGATSGFAVPIAKI